MADRRSLAEPGPIQGPFFARAGGRGFKRPFELATVRLLSNMSEVLGHWRTYVP